MDGKRGASREGGGEREEAEKKGLPTPVLCWDDTYLPRLSRTGHSVCHTIGTSAWSLKLTG